jgi:DNA polymerase I-like protein with 3'-5' exonuclease and polymerase domains
VAALVKKQEEHGFKLNIKKTQELMASLQGKMVEIEERLQHTFPPDITTGRKHKTSGKPLADIITPFNPGSRQQIAERLQRIGATFTKKTEKGQIVIDEKVLGEIEMPEAALLGTFLTLQKRVAQIQSWLEEVQDGRVHGKVITNGAVTGRMTHSSPNMAQVPNSGSPYGEECREVWQVEEGNVLVGADASGLELRMLAHYMRDEAYVDTVINGSSKDGTDVHTKNQKAAGLPSRDAAKTFIYAFLYGAGAPKIGSIIGGGAKEGNILMTRFLKATPKLKALKDKVAVQAAKGWLPGLDGRRIRVRSQHAALNSLLQGAGAVVMKQALVILESKLRKQKVVYGVCANVHDEWQIETTKDKGELVGRLAVEAITEAGVVFKLRCPLSGEYKVGNNWKETH